MSDQMEFPAIEEIFEEGLSRAQIKKLRRKRTRGNIQGPDHNFILREVAPKTDNQARVFDLFEDGKHLMLSGVSGTGKTFIATYLALREVMDHESKFKKVLIVRSAVPSRDMGFMPGNLREKAAMYELPYQGHFSELFGRGDAYTIMKQKGLVDFITTSFVRGTTIESSIVIIDEIQNLDAGEIHSVITRLGKNTRLIACGDYRQDDLARRKGENSGFAEMYSVLTSMKSVGAVDFQIEDVVRSGFVKEYLLARFKLGLE